MASMSLLDGLESAVDEFGGSGLATEARRRASRATSSPRRWDSTPSWPRRTGSPDSASSHNQSHRAMVDARSERSFRHPLATIPYGDS